MVCVCLRCGQHAHPHSLVSRASEDVLHQGVPSAWVYGSMIDNGRRFLGTTVITWLRFPVGRPPSVAWLSYGCEFVMTGHHTVCSVYICLVQISNGGICTGSLFSRGNRPSRFCWYDSN